MRSRAAVIAFAFGYLLGERRAVANAILDANMRELFKSIDDSPEKPPDSEEVEARLAVTIVDC
jgi:hypothetical protein